MRVFIAVAVLLALLIGVFVFENRNGLSEQQMAELDLDEEIYSSTSTPPEESVAATSTEEIPPEEEVEEDVSIVRYTSLGFSPLLLEITVGERVRFVNGTAEELSLIAVGRHAEDNRIFDRAEPVAPSSNTTFTFSRTGIYEYGNEQVDGDVGMILVLPPVR